VRLAGEQLLSEGGDQAHALLRALAVVGDGTVPAEVVRRMADEGSDVEAAVARLEDLALGSRGEEGALWMHVAVQSEVGCASGETARRAAALAAVQAVDRSFPFSWRDPDTWRPSSSLVTHALVAGRRAGAAGAEVEPTASLLERAASYLLRHHRPVEARRAFERAVRLRESDPNEDGAMLARALHELGHACRVAGLLGAARRAVERSLDIDRDRLGTDADPRVVASIRELGKIAAAEGDLDEAVRLMEQTLEHGAADPGAGGRLDEAMTSTELGRILVAKGDLDAAARAMDRALEIKVELFGTDTHAQVAASLHELAGIHRDRGDLDAAERALARSLEIRREAAGGADDRDVAASLHELGSVALARGDHEAARDRYEEALEIKGRVGRGGRRDPSSALTAEALASALTALGEAERAEELLRRAHEDFARTLGPAHRHTRRLALRLRSK
jgi:tetratricopeptide (TPR) repeat protein